jgi:hypothetical protein
VKDGSNRLAGAAFTVRTLSQRHKNSKMKTTTRKTSLLVCVLLGVLAAGLARGATTIRYNGSGDYNDVLAVKLSNGWPAGTSGTNGLPGANDLIRFNWGGNLVTLTNPAQPVWQFQCGVDEQGTFQIESGGVFTAMGSTCKVGNGGNLAGTGQLIIKTNGIVNVGPVLYVGGGASGTLLIDGGTLNQSNHLWVGDITAVTGTIILTNGGVLNMLAPGGNGMLGLGTHNATATPSGGVGFIKVTDGSTANFYNIDGAGNSIQAGSVLDISGSGVVTFPGDKTATLNTYYITPGKITAFGGTGTIAMDYGVTTPNKTTLKAVGGYVPPVDALWDPAHNPAGLGFWNENENWTNISTGSHLRPASVTAVTFDLVGATPCTITNPAVASSILMGDTGPGGRLTIASGGILSCSSENPSIIGNNSNALLVVENGGVATFGTNLWIGYNWGADGTLLMNGGSVSVAKTFSLGGMWGKGTAQIKGGTLNLGQQWTDLTAIQGDSVLDVSGTGKVIINGDSQAAVNYFVLTGQITNSVTTNLLVDYNIINLGKTTIYPADLYLSPAQAVWNPAQNTGDTLGLWNMSTNWTVGMCPGNSTVVTFNVPDAIPCIITNAATAYYVAMGSGGPGGTLIVTNGGSLITGRDNWTAVGYNNTATMRVENGASVNFGYHLWIGFDPTADGTFIMNGGTVSVGGMFGLGWNGGKATAQINGGTLNLNQWSTANPGSIAGTSVLNLTGTGTVVITGNYVSSISNYVYTGKITANGGPNVACGFDSVANKTTLQVAPPRQSVTSVTASGANTIITCETTAGHIYHLESTPTLSPTAWTRVAGTTTNAPGAAVSFTVPTGSGQLFYRTVSP